MQKLRNIVIFGLTCFMVQLSQAASIPCVVQLVKDSCWRTYTIRLQAYDAQTLHAVGKVIVLPGQKQSVEAAIPCQANQELTFKASFSPKIWGEGKDTIYHAQHVWNVPMQVSKDANKWLMKICFAKDFTDVPMPLMIKGDCVCQFPDDTPAAKKTLKTK